MSAATRLVTASEPVCRPERLALVAWTARLGAVTAEALAQRDEVSIASARARLAAAERADLLVRRNAVIGSPALYAATRLGLRVAGMSALGTCRISASNAVHLAACAFVAAALESRYPNHRVTGERELRLDERELGAPLASARLHAPGAQGGLWHRPDLVLWPVAGLPTAVEVELTAKAPRRLQEICRAWARTRCVAGVLYLAAPGVEAALERAITRAGAAERVLVVPLTAIRGCTEGG